MKSLVHGILVGSISVLVAAALCLVSLEVQESFRVHKERKQCRKLGGYYDHLGRCEAKDGTILKVYGE